MTSDRSRWVCQEAARACPSLTTNSSTAAAKKYGWFSSCVCRPVPGVLCLSLGATQDAQKRVCVHAHSCVFRKRFFWCPPFHSRFCDSTRTQWHNTREQSKDLIRRRPYFGEIKSKKQSRKATRCATICHDCRWNVQSDRNGAHVAASCWSVSNIRAVL